MAYKKWTASAKQLTGDPRYQSKLISKFVNCLMWDGKKAVAQKVFYDAMDIIAGKIKDTPPQEVFEKAVDNVKPMVEVRSKRVGGANYQVPMQVNRRRQLSLAIRWIIQAVRAAAFRREGAAMSTRENVHRMADANKAFAHFAW